MIETPKDFQPEQIILKPGTVDNISHLYKKVYLSLYFGLHTKEINRTTTEFTPPKSPEKFFKVGSIWDKKLMLAFHHLGYLTVSGAYFDQFNNQGGKLGSVDLGYGHYFYIGIPKTENIDHVISAARDLSFTEIKSEDKADQLSSSGKTVYSVLDAASYSGYVLEE